MEATAFSKKTVVVSVTHSNKAHRCHEVKLDMHMTVENLKLKLFTMIATSPPNMKLILQDEHGRNLCSLIEDSKPLGFYSLFDGCIIHVVDTDPHSLVNQGWLDDVSKVQKYVISDADYEKRDNAFRKFRQQQLQQQKGGGSDAQPPAKPVVPCSDEQLAVIERASLAAERCLAEPGSRPGIVRYCGPVKCMADGVWVGVELEEPLGKHDGSKDGKRYFRAAEGHGIFVRPTSITLQPQEAPHLGPEDEI